MITEGLLTLFIRVSRQQRNKANDLLNQLGLHAGQEVVLMHIAEGEGITITDLSQQVTIRLPTLTRTIDRLTQKGFVQRNKDNRDGRLARLSLTPAGKAVLSDIQGVWQQIEQSLINGLTADEHSELKRILQKLDQ